MCSIAYSITKPTRIYVIFNRFPTKINHLQHSRPKIAFHLTDGNIFPNEIRRSSYKIKDKVPDILTIFFCTFRGEKYFAWNIGKDLWQMQFFILFTILPHKKIHKRGEMKSKKIEESRLQCFEMWKSYMMNSSWYYFLLFEWDSIFMQYSWKIIIKSAGTQHGNSNMEKKYYNATILLHNVFQLIQLNVPTLVNQF